MKLAEWGISIKRMIKLFVGQSDISKLSKKWHKVYGSNFRLQCDLVTCGLTSLWSA